MPISFRCINPKCGKTMRAPDGTAGRKSKCPLCGTVQIIPQPDPDDLPTFSTDDDLPTFGADLENSPPPPTQSGQVHCMDCKKQFPASAIVCPGCGWVNQQAMGGSMPTPAKPKTGGLMKECFYAISYGYSNFGSLLKLVSFSITMIMIFYFLFTFSAIFAVFGGLFGILLCAGVIISAQLVIGGYFLRFYLDCIVSSLEGLDQAPEVPDFQFAELCKVGLKGLGILCVYVFPLITIPLLPMALLAWGYSDDLRAFDIKWAFKAAVKKPKQLGQLWVMLIFWGIIGSVIVEASEQSAAFIIEALGNAIGTGFGAWLLKFILLLLAAFVISAVAQMFMAILFRCIGIMGHSNSDIIQSLPEETSTPVTAAYITGGVIATICVFAVLAGFAAKNIADMFPAREPDQEEVAQVGWEEQPKYEHREKRADYLSLVMRAKDSGQLSAAAQTMRSLGTTIKSYEAEKGKYPDTLNDLVTEGLTVRKMILSKKDPSKPIVYNKPAYLSNSDWIVAYDPSPEHGDMFAVLFNSGSVQDVHYKELDAMLKKQGSPAVE